MFVKVKCEDSLNTEEIPAQLYSNEYTAMNGPSSSSLVAPSTVSEVSNKSGRSGDLSTDDTLLGYAKFAYAGVLGGGGYGYGYPGFGYGYGGGFHSPYYGYGHGHYSKIFRYIL